MEIASHFQALADAFMSGEHEDLADMFVHPLVIYGTKGIHVERTREETLLVLSEQLHSARKRGAVAAKTTTEVSKVEPGERLPITVRWQFFDAAGGECGRARIRYFARLDNGAGLQIELVEVIDTTLVREPGIRVAGGYH